MKNLSKNINAISCICKIMLGASIVALPNVFKNLGILWASLSIIFCMFINIFSSIFIVKSAEESKQKNLIEIAKYCGDKKAEYITAFLLFCSSIVSLTFYLTITLDYSNDILQYFNIYVKKECLRVFIAILIIIVCFIFREGKFLYVCSRIGLALLLTFLIYIGYLFFINFATIEFSQFNYTNLTPQSFSSLSLILFVFYSQDCILSIFEQFKENALILNPNKNNDQKSTQIWLSNMICAFIYIISGCIGYFVAPNAGLNVLTNLETNLFVMIIKFLLGLVNVFTYPLNILPTRLTIWYVFYKNKNIREDSSKIYNMIIGIMFMVYSCSIAVSYEENILNALFYLSGSIVMFAMPAYFFFETYKEKHSLFDKIIMLFCMLLTIFGIFNGFAILKLAVSNFSIFNRAIPQNKTI